MQTHGRAWSRCGIRRRPPVGYDDGAVRHTVTDAEPGKLDDPAAGISGPERKPHLHQRSFGYDGTADPNAPGGMAAIYRSMVSDRARNQTIVDDICRALARRCNCLILTRRTAHLETFVSMLAARGHQAVVLGLWI